MKTTRSISAALTLTLALALTGCDDGEDGTGGQTSDAATVDEDTTATATEDAAGTASESPTEDVEQAEDSAGATAGTDAEEATASDDDTDDDGQDDDSDGVVGGGPSADLTPSALAAIETALAEVEDEATAYEVDDREDGFWEVDVMVADGAAEVTVAPDGTTVDGTADDADDALEDAGRQALAEAQVSLAEAIVAAVQAAEGQLDSAELTEAEGRWWWKVVVDSANQDDIELRVDPGTGEVVANAG